jgi:serine/threonine protein kinase
MENISSDFIPMDDDIGKADCFTDFQSLPTNGFNRLVRARRGGKWWVLKTLKEPYLADPAYTGLLHKEADILSLVQGVGTPECKGLEQVPGLGPCIVMEWIDGVTLEEWLKTKHSRAERLRIARELIAVCSRFHHLQVVHRDLKPSNIMVTRNGQHVIVIDFGLADTYSYNCFKQPAGSTGYISEEQMKSAQPDLRNDIYALGKILQQLRLGPFYRLAIRRYLCPIRLRYEDAKDIRHAVQLLHSVALLILLVIAFIGIAIPLQKTRAITDKNTYYEIVTEFRFGDLRYRSWGGGLVSVSGYATNSTCIEIPEKVNYKGVSYQVSEIGFHAFERMPHLQAVILPEGDLDIMRGAFTRCPELRTISFRYGKCPPHFGSKQWKVSINEVFTPKQFKTVTLVVPRGSLQRFRNSPWGRFKHIKEWE